MLDLFVLEFFKEEVLFDIGEVFVEVVGEIVPEELLEKERLDLREDIYTTLLTIESLELGVVARPVPLLLHYVVLITVWP